MVWVRVRFKVRVMLRFWVRVRVSVRVRVTVKGLALALALCQLVHGRTSQILQYTARHAEREVMRQVEVFFSFFIRSGVESAAFFVGDDHAS